MRAKGAAERRDFLAETIEANPYEQRRRRLFECGEVVASYGDYADVRVGYGPGREALVLEEVHVISGYRPEVGTWVSLRYLNGHPGEPMVVGPAVTAAEPPETEQAPGEVVGARSSSHFGAFGSLDGRLEAAEGVLLAKFDPSSGHTHAGSAGQGPALTQARTHLQADTDSAPTALHHTLGTGSNQAASGSHRHAYLQWLLEETAERLLRGTLDTKTAVPVSRTYAFGNGPTDKNNILTTTGNWAAYPGYLASGSAGATAQVTLRTAGTNNVVLSPGAAPAYPCRVEVRLDGAVHGTWNQQGGAGYTLAGVGAGIHTILLTEANETPEVDELYLGSITCSVLPYQGVGGPGTVVRSVMSTGELCVTSVGCGPTNNGALYNPLIYGTDIISKLPLGAGLADSSFTRDSVALANLPAVSTGIVKAPVYSHLHTGQGWGFPRMGTSYILQATASIRGYQVLGNPVSDCYTYLLSNSVLHLVFRVELAEVLTVGGASGVSVGDLVLLVVADTYWSSAAVYTRLQTNATLFVAADIFKIPSGLL